MWAVLSRSTNAIRRLFDLLSSHLTPFLVVALLGAFAVLVGGRQTEYLTDAEGEGPKVSLVRVEVTFNAQRFASFLEGESELKEEVVNSFVTWDALFPPFYGVALVALFLWAERWRRFNTKDDPRKDESLRLQRDLLILAPLAAALLDLIVENTLLFFAGRSILQNAASVSALWLEAFVWIGSLGGAMKWILLLLFLLGVLRELASGPRGDVLWRIRFSVIALLVGGIPLLATAQGQDILQRLVEREHPVLRVGTTVAGMTFVALALWYCGRKLVQLTFRDDSTPDDLKDWYEYFGKHIPRLIGVTLLVLCGLAFAKEGLAQRLFVGLAGGGYVLTRLINHFWPAVLEVIGKVPATFFRGALDSDDFHDFCNKIGRAILAILIGLLMYPQETRTDLWYLGMAAWLCLSAAWILYLYVSFRREVRGIAPETAVSSRRAEEIPRQLKQGVAVAATFSFIILLSFTFAPVSVGRLLGPVWILAFATANAVFIGSITVWVGRVYGVPVARIALATALFFSLWNDNHDVVAGSDPVPERQTLAADFNAWWNLQPTTNRAAPVVLVAAHGGGLRAAYWTAAALAELQDRTENAFGEHLYAISSVSGGSLGGGLFAGMLRDTGQGAPSRGCPKSKETYHDCVRRFMADDFVSPLLAKLAAPDFLQMFLPIPIRSFDRSAGLERSWEVSYFATTGRNTFGERFLELRKGDGTRRPALFLNATSVETGRRSIASSVKVDTGDGKEAFRDSYDTLKLLGSDIRLSTAIHNSSRFAYFSPAGHLRNDTKKPPQELGHLVDGGYFENSGLATLAQIREIILQQNVEGRDLIVLYLCNDPRPCAADLKGVSDAVRSTALDELLSPVRASLSTRDARGSLARATLKDVDSEKFYQLNVCPPQPKSEAPQDKTLEDIAQRDKIKQRADRVVSPPLSWILSNLAQEWMDGSLGRAGAPAGIDPVCVQQNKDIIEELSALMKR